MKKCLYHANCNDGIAAALAVWLANPKMRPDKDFIPVQYGQDPPWDDIASEPVVIVDFSYKSSVMQGIMGVVTELTVLDHHASAKRELVGLNGAVLPNGQRAEIIFDMSRSGAVMAWEHFHPEREIPELLLYVQDRDLWRKKLPGCDAVSMWLRSWPMELRIWDNHLNHVPVERMATEGGAISRWFNLQCQQLYEAWGKHPTFSVIDGHKVPVINASGFMASELGHLLAHGHPFAAVFFHVPGGVVYSLRRAEGSVDLSVVAASMGGGGHPAAAGFKCKGVLP